MTFFHLCQSVVERPRVMLIAVFTFVIISSIIYNFLQKTCKQGEIQINYSLSYKYCVGSNRHYRCTHGVKLESNFRCEFKW